MWPYILATTILAIFAAFSTKRRPNRLLWGVSFILFVLFVGLRHKVGMDWNNYLIMIERAGFGSLTQALIHSEPGYALLLWLADGWGVGIYGANLVGALIFFMGLFRFAKTTHSPWLALTTAMPILVVVVAMSANRQAVAIGILLWLLADWQKSLVIKRVFLVVLAGMFHYSAIFFLAFVIFDVKARATYKAFAAVLLTGILIVFLDSTESVNYYDNLYVGGQTQQTYSPGAIMHVLLNGLPALLILFVGRKYRAVLYPSAVYKNMALFAIVLIPAAFFFSAASGRMTLYLFPVSMYVFSTLPKLVIEKKSQTLIAILIAGVMVSMTWFWLEFANSSRAHIPYKNAIFMDRWELHIR